MLADCRNEWQQSYRTLAQLARGCESDVRFPMRNCLPGLTAGYIARHRTLENHLRQQLEQIAALVMAAAARDRSEAVGAVVGWLNDWPPSPTSQAADETPPLAFAA